MLKCTLNSFAVLCIFKFIWKYLKILIQFRGILVNIIIHSILIHICAIYLICANYLIFISIILVRAETSKQLNTIRARKACCSWKCGLNFNEKNVSHLFFKWGESMHKFLVHTETSQKLGHWSISHYHLIAKTTGKKVCVIVGNSYKIFRLKMVFPPNLQFAWRLELLIYWDWGQFHSIFT